MKLKYFNVKQTNKQINYLIIQILISSFGYLKNSIANPPLNKPSGSTLPE